MRTTEDLTLKCVIKRVNNLTTDPKSKDNVAVSLWKLGYKVKRYLESEEISKVNSNDKEVLSKSHDIILKNEERLIRDPMMVLNDLEECLKTNALR